MTREDREDEVGRRGCRLRRVRKAYGPHVVLDEFDLAVASGEMVAVTGPSGSGKSTILNILGMLERPDGGQVEICGVRNPRLTSRPGRELLRRRVAYLFQNGALIDDATVAANLRVAMHAAGRRRRDEAHRMRAALRRVGLDVPLNQPVATLSGGEQQRLAFARILLRPVEVLLADEPTGSLDEGNRDALLQLLRDLNHEGTTVVVVTHDPAVERACQRSIRLKGPVRSARRPEVAPTAETASTRTSRPDGSQQLGDADAK